MCHFQGFLKLGDLGLAAYLDDAGRHYSNSGTAAYQSPEMRRKGHSHGVGADIFALAVTAFELVGVFRPFAEEVEEDRGATDGKRRLKLVITIDDDEAEASVDHVRNLSPALRDWLVTGLKYDEYDRFSSVKEMREHRWFAGFDWDALEQRRMKAPFKSDFSRLTRAMRKLRKDIPPLTSAEPVTPDEEVLFKRLFESFNCRRTGKLARPWTSTPAPHTPSPTSSVSSIHLVMPQDTLAQATTTSKASGVKALNKGLATSAEYRAKATPVAGPEENDQDEAVLIANDRASGGDSGSSWATILLDCRVASTVVASARS